jgi:GNAT superfamily N-acetyltransferase
MHDLERLTDRIELASLADWFGGLPEAVTNTAGVRSTRVGGVLVAVLGCTPSAVYTRALGLDLEEAASLEQVREVLASLERLGGTRAFLHLPAYARPELAGWFEELGLRCYQRSWMRFCRGDEPAPEVNTELVIRPAEPEDAAEFDLVARTAFEMPAPASGLFGCLVGRPRWHTFVAAEGDQIVGAAGLFVEGEVGHVAFGGVVPSSRRRGGQRALLAARVKRALELGCTVMFTETGEAVPDQPQQSYPNILRAGFRELYLKPNYLWSRQPA